MAAQLHSKLLFEILHIGIFRNLEILNRFGLHHHLTSVVEENAIREKVLPVVLLTHFSPMTDHLPVKRMSTLLTQTLMEQGSALGLGAKC